MMATIFFEEHLPPRLDEVKSYFSERNMNSREAEDFYRFYELKNWTARNGNLIKNWRPLAGKWISTAIASWTKDRLDLPVNVAKNV